MTLRACFFVLAPALSLAGRGPLVLTAGVAQRPVERPVQRVALDLNSRQRSVIILVPGTSVGYLLPGRPPPSTYPDLPNWTPHPPRILAVRNTADALADGGRTLLGERDIDLRVYAKGAENSWEGPAASESTIPWYGADSQYARAIASAELARRIDQIPRDVPVALICYSHGCTVGTAAANSSQRGVEGIVSLAHPGWEQADPNKVRVALNFYLPGDLVRGHAGDNDGKGGPVRSPGKIVERAPFHRNFELHDATSANPGAWRPVGDHLAITDPRLIDALIAPAVRSWLAQVSSLGSAPTVKPVGDLLTQTGPAYNPGNPSPRTTLPGAEVPRSPFEFGDPGANASVQPVGSAPAGPRPLNPEPASPLDQVFQGVVNPAPAAPPLATPPDNPTQPPAATPPETPPDNPKRGPASRTPIRFHGPDESIRVPTLESWQREMAWRIEGVSSIGQATPKSPPPLVYVTVRKSDLWRADNREYVGGREVNVLASRDGALQQASSVPSEADRRIHATMARWHQEFIAAAGLRASPEYDAIRPLYQGKASVNYPVAGYAQLAQP